MYEEDRQEHGWMTFRIGEEKMLYISKEGTRSSAVGNYNKKSHEKSTIEECGRH